MTMFKAGDRVTAKVLKVSPQFLDDIVHDAKDEKGVFYFLG